MDARPGHAYQAPTPSDSRSPCPALNAAANHGYLPHSGKDLSFLQLVHCLREVYNLSYPLATVLSLGGILLCGNKLKFTLDLAALDQHNKIEHDASLLRQNASEGDSVHVNQSLLDNLLAQSTDGKGLTLADFARVRAERLSKVPGGKLDRLHTGFASGESVMIVNVVGDGQEISLDAVKSWMGLERLPAGWMPHGPTGLLEVLSIQRTFNNMLEKAKRGEKID